jgi:hypothetical protein
MKIVRYAARNNFFAVETFFENDPTVTLVPVNKNPNEVKLSKDDSWDETLVENFPHIEVSK